MNHPGLDLIGGCRECEPTKPDMFVGGAGGGAHPPEFLKIIASLYVSKSMILLRFTKYLLQNLKIKRKSYTMES